MNSWAADLFDYWPLRIFFRVLAVLFAFGAAVHAANIMGFGGFRWEAAPVSWRVFDIVFLFLDMAVVIGVLLRKGWAVASFLIACGLQIVLYGIFPAEFAATAEQATAVQYLVYLNFALIGIFGGLVLLRERGE